MTFFGQYLVDNGLIDDSTLLTALVGQLDGIPAVASIIYQHNLLAPSDQLRILEHQWKTGSECRQACLDLGLWSQGLSLEINRLLGTARKPLGQILIEKGSIDLKTLTATLDRFLSSRAVQAPIVVDKPQAAVSRPEVNTEPVVAKLDLTECYPDFFDDDLYAGLKALVEKENSDGLRQLIHSLVFVGRYTGLSLSEMLWNRVAEVLKNSQAKDCASWLLSAVDIGWDLRCAVFAGLEEGGYLESTGGRKAYDECCRVITILNVRH